MQAYAYDGGYVQPAELGARWAASHAQVALQLAH